MSCTSPPTKENVRQASVTKQACANQVVAGHFVWHFPVCVRALLDSAGQVLCSAAATLVLFLFYVFGDMMEQLVFSDCSPIVGWAIVQDEHSGIKTGRVINDKHIYKPAVTTTNPSLPLLARRRSSQCAGLLHKPALSSLTQQSHTLATFFNRRTLVASCKTSPRLQLRWVPRRSNRPLIC